MGRSIQERPISISSTFYHRLSNRHYSIRDGIMRRHQLDAQGNQINIIEKNIHLGIGSGNHAITYVNRTRLGSLLELPVSWYAEQKSHAMSPGYDRPDHLDMRREISPACLFCHAAYPRPGVTQPRSIDCERCHGSSAAHLQKPQRGTILNPARLAPKARLEVCLQCHLETVSQGIPDSFRQPKRDPFSYRPGEPLSSYKLYFDRADSPQPRFEVNHAGYRLMHSKCYTESKGQMTCTTCHDPHTAQARNTCGSCHSTGHSKAATNCTGCHMPKRRTNDAIHVAMTDHWIQRNPQFTNPTQEDRTPYTGPVVSFYTPADELTLAIANIREPNSQAVDLYRRRLKLDPDDVPTLAALGNVLFRLNRLKEAQAALDRAIRNDPGHAGALNTLAVSHATQGAHARAIELLQRAAKHHPDHALTWFNLGVTYQAMGRSNDAANAYREAIRLQPDFSEARARLATIQANR
jgi:tetratricopeptide (TPR) repeat protein